MNLNFILPPIKSNQDWFLHSRYKTGTQAASTTLQFGDFVRTQTVRSNASYSKEKVKKLSNRDSSDNSDGGPCWSDHERVPGTKAGEPGSCRPKGEKKKKKRKKKKPKMPKMTEMTLERDNASTVPGKGDIHAKGADADGDGKTGEGKYSKADWKKDSDGDGKPDPVDTSSSEYDTDYSSEEETPTKKRANASAKESDCDCDCPESLAKKAKAIAEAAKATLSRDNASAKKARCDGGDDCDCDLTKETYVASVKYEGVSQGKIYKTPGGSKEFVVVVDDKIVRFGDPSMDNHNDDDGARANFMARHKCSEQKDRTSAAYWACRVWRKGFRKSEVPVAPESLK